MKQSNDHFILLMLIIVMTFFIMNCGTRGHEEVSWVDHEPAIDPDYSGVTIPANIAPMNFTISERGEFFQTDVFSSNGTRLTFRSRNQSVRFPLKDWKRMLAGSVGGKIKIEVTSGIKGGKVEKYKPFYLNVARERIDPYLCYRTLYPGYESWGEMKIIQRSLEDFKEFPLVENQLLAGNCVNCHSFVHNKPDKYLIHVRGSKAGTYFINNDTIIRRELKTKEMPGNAVYPAWHPSGKYVVFSSNMIFSVIHMHPDSNVELYDRYSILVIFDTEKNEMSVCGKNYKGDFMETYPVWSPDGNYLYYSRTSQVKPGFDYRQIKYDVARMSFDEEKGIFGNPEVILNAQAINKSASFPTISPDGQYLVVTLHNFGTFPNWHREADLYSLSLKDGKLKKMTLNSNETESYSSWSSNGRWLVFSSKRGDGLTSRPYFAFFSNPDSIGKPFILPQKDPGLYKRFEKSFNKPELVSGKIKTGPRKIAGASERESVKAIWIENK